MTTDLKTLRSVAEGATPGPWRVRTNRHTTTDGEEWGWVSNMTTQNISLPGMRSGKRRTRREKFWQTLNPFNKNADGEPKTAQEIRVELAEKIKAWRAEPITCDDCRPSAQSCTSGNVQFRSHDAALNPTGVGEAG